MTLTGHLDLVRLFDRAVRRAALPIAFTGGFHPGPRISIANALPLGVSSSGEIVDFELTQKLEVTELHEKLAAQLPAEIPIYHVEEIALKSLPATQLLEKAEYLLTVAASEAATIEQWQSWIDRVNNTSEIYWEKTTKSGKMTQVNLRDHLFSLTLETEKNEASNTKGLSNLSLVKLRYQGSCCNDGTLLQPEQVIYMLEQFSQQELHLLHAHRQKLLLAVN
jgi:radical SAM-linked protein